MIFHFSLSFLVQIFNSCNALVHGTIKHWPVLRIPGIIQRLHETHILFKSCNTASMARRGHVLANLARYSEADTSFEKGERIQLLKEIKECKIDRD
jgi:hypothetical protein